MEYQGAMHYLREGWPLNLIVLAIGGAYAVSMISSLRETNYYNHRTHRSDDAPRKASPPKINIRLRESELRSILKLK